MKASLVAQMVKNLPVMQETCVQFLGQEDPLKKEMATHSSVLAWRIPWTEEPGGLQSMGSQRVDMTEQLTLSLSFQFLEGDAALYNLSQLRDRLPCNAPCPCKKHAICLFFSCISPAKSAFLKILAGDWSSEGQWEWYINYQPLVEKSPKTVLLCFASLLTLVIGGKMTHQK